MQAGRKPILLIDGDQFLYKACAAVEKEIRWDEENHCLFSNADEAWELFQGSLRKVTEALQVSEARIAFTKGQSFRTGLYEGYKANRVGTRKPMCFVEVRERAEKEYTTYSFPGLEADDVLGIWATRPSNLDPIIVSDDKDLKTIPGKLYRMGELSTITPADADYYWMFQTLVGDQTDGYPGLRGTGPKTAEKLLDARWGQTRLASISMGEWLWPVVVQAYEKAGLTAEDALLQARLARILRAEDWDTAKKEVRLWQP